MANVADKLIEVREASFHYDKSKAIFEHIGFALGEGEVFCIVGPNGCGKSTLIDCVLGLNKLSSGSVLISGSPIESYKAKDYAEKVAYVPQKHKGSFAYTVLDVVTMGRTYAARTFSPPDAEQKAIAREAIATVGLAGFEDREYTRLSGGELQLVLIARAVAQQSRVLVMDEPTAHLDFRHELEVMEIVSRLVTEKKISIIMATHFLNQAFYLENAGVPTRVALMEGMGFAQVGLASEVLTETNLAETFHIVTEIVGGGKGERKYILPLYNKKEKDYE